MSSAASSAVMDCRAAIARTIQIPVHGQSQVQDLRVSPAVQSRLNYLSEPGNTASAVAPMAEPAMRAVPITALAASPTVPTATEATVSATATTAQPGRFSADNAAANKTACRNGVRGGKFFMIGRPVSGG